jgi:magnesium protoporphyrin O-methyltransferase
VTGREGLREYFDARAAPFDRLYEGRPGPLGWAQAWVHAPLRHRLGLTLRECADRPGERVLDAGCGSGRYSVAFAERGAEVVGIDISPAMLALARARADERGVAGRCRFVLADLDADVPGAPFDTVLAVGLLDYYADAGAVLARLAGLAARRVVVSFPEPWSWRSRARAARYRLRGTPPALHTHSRRRMAEAFRAAGFARVRIAPGWAAGYLTAAGESASASSS